MWCGFCGFIVGVIQCRRVNLGGGLFVELRGDRQAGLIDRGLIVQAPFGLCGEFTFLPPLGINRLKLLPVGRLSWRDGRVASFDVKFQRAISGGGWPFIIDRPIDHVTGLHADDVKRQILIVHEFLGNARLCHRVY